MEVLGFLGREGLLLASVLLLFLVLCGFGSSLGLPNLFWRATVDARAAGPRDRILIGIAVGVLLGAYAFLGVLVESAQATWSVEFFLRWFHGLCVAASLLMFAIWLWRPSGRPSKKGMLDRNRLESVVVPIGSAVGLVGFVVLVWLLFEKTPAWTASLIGRFVPKLTSPELFKFHVIAGVLLFFGTLLYLVLQLLNRLAHMPPAVAICVLLGIVGAFHGFVAFRLPGAQLPAYLGVLGVYVCLNTRYQRARVPDLEEPWGTVQSTRLLPDEGVLEVWRKRHKTPPVLVVVAADGGGVRSALWTATVLTRLEQEWPTFARHVRLFTGASGGMLGATLWTATLVDSEDAKPPHHATGGKTLTPNEFLNIAEKGGLSAVAAGLVYRDILPPPFRRGPDRGRELEMVWEKNCAELAAPLSALAEGEKDGWRPSLVLAPMLVEDGRRLLITNLDLAHLLAHEGPFASCRRPYSLGGVQLFEKLPGAYEKLRTSTAVRLQANFPWALPSTELPPLDPSGPRFRVVDAGYYDDSGVDLACLWIFQHRDWLKAHTSGVLLVQNRDKSSAVDRNQLPSKRRRCLVRGLDGILTPISGGLSARSSTTWYRNDAAVAALSQVFAGGETSFTTVVFELEIEAALTWSITPEEAYKIRKNIDEQVNRKVLEDLKDWWQKLPCR